VRKHLWILAGLLAGSYAIYAVELPDLRAWFAKKQFDQLLDPLIDYRLKRGDTAGPDVDELDYMVATTFCSLHYDKDGCEYATKLKPVLVFQSRTFRTRDAFAPCCERAGMSRPCSAGSNGKADTQSDPNCASSDGKFDRANGPSGRSLERILQQVQGVRTTSSPSKCASRVQGRIAWDYQGSTTWDPQNVTKLCGGTSRPYDPPICFERVMHDGTNWGGGTRWEWRNALELCAGTSNATATIECFQKNIAQGTQWPDAIQVCKQKLISPGVLNGVVVR
jgi:hypothetical protein